MNFFQARSQNNPPGNSAEPESTPVQSVAQPQLSAQQSGQQVAHAFDASNDTSDASNDASPPPTNSPSSEAVNKTVTSEAVEGSSGSQPATNNGEFSAQGMMLFLGIVASLSFAIFVYRRAKRSGILYRVLSKFRSPQVPCSQCRFFNSNPHLKCAIHPSRVFTSDAINCPDQWLKGNNKFTYHMQDADKAR